MATTKTRKQSEITSAAIFRCSDKVTGECLGYAVPSDTTNDTYYVTYDHKAHRYCCSCPARTEKCKHVRAVLEVVEARREIQKEAAPVAASTVATYDVVAEAVEVVKQATPTYGVCGHLHKREDEECGACRSRSYR